jgi:hypothetical protein
MSTSESFDAMVTLSARVAHGGRPKTRGGWELDVVEHRHKIVWRRGEVRDAKRQMNRRQRRQWRQRQHGAVRAARASQRS